MKYICTCCKKKYNIDKILIRCTECFEPIELQKFNNSKINITKDNVFERYEEFFPFNNINFNMSLGEGNTPLTKLNNISSNYGFKEFYIKNESMNPTWSFKDRGTFTCFLHANNMNIKNVGTVSTGNMAPSVAAYAAKNNYNAYIFVSEDIPEEKLLPISVYSKTLVKVIGNYSSLYYKSIELGNEKGIYFMNSDVPFRVEGSKTISFEIFDQLNDKIPDVVLVPTSSGGNLRGIYKGFEELMLNGYINKIPKIVCVQASGCSPIVNANKKNKKKIDKIENPETIASAIKNPYPPSGNKVLNMLDDDSFISVNDEEILLAQNYLSYNGLFAQPASCVPIAALPKLVERKTIKPSDTVVSILTGAGIKYTSSVKNNISNIIEVGIDNLNSIID